MVEVRLDNLRKEFAGGSIVAVDDFSLTIQDGEFVTLVGPSGCGKTTTLRMIAGLENPTRGSISFDETEITDLPPQQRGIALLFQDIALYPHMTALENIAYPLKILGVDPEEREERAREVANWLQIEELMNDPPSELSGGQQQRVALARSMVRDPNMFLFDEPMSDLDAKLKRELRPLFEEVTQEVGCPTLYVTHDQEEAMTLSDRVAIMNDGNLAQVGAPEEVYDDPDSQFVGEFIGQPTMEFFEAELRANGSDVEFDLGGQTWTKVLNDGIGEYDGQVVTVGIRPQDLSVSEDPTDGIPGEHVLDEPLGDRTISYFDTDYGRITAVTHPHFRGDGEEYGLVVDTTETKFFDNSSGVRIRVN